MMDGERVGEVGREERNGGMFGETEGEVWKLAYRVTRGLRSYTQGHRLNKNLHVRNYPTCKIALPVEHCEEDGWRQSYRKISSVHLQGINPRLVRSAAVPVDHCVKEQMYGFFICVLYSIWEDSRGLEETKI